ncbi:hypothetical protein Ancab_029703 [Ancistrocladus abbreviatus]
MKLVRLLLQRTKLGRTSKRRNITTATRIDMSRKWKRAGTEVKDRRVAKRMKILTSMFGQDDATDVAHISDMPEPVIHHILSFLHPKDAARMSILSKRWKCIWDSFPILVFNQHYFRRWGRDSIKMFKNLIDFSLHGRMKQELSIHKFRLCVNNDPNMQLHIFDWVDGALDLNVKDLEIKVKPWKHMRACILPPSVLAANSITVLNLSGCRLVACDGIKLPLLQKLLLKKLDLCEQLLQGLINGCPLIQDLRLVQCTGLKNIVISTASGLNRVDLHKCEGLESVKLDTPRLQSFWFYAKKQVRCIINLSACRTLKELMLQYPKMTDDMFQRQILEFPGLEKLVLSKCSALKNIQVSGEQLKKLVIRKCWKLVQVLIGAPNLYSLEFEGANMPISLLNPSSIREAKLSFKPLSKGSSDGSFCSEDYRTKLEEFIGKIQRSKGLKSVTLHKLFVTVYEDLRTIPFALGMLSGMQLQISTRLESLIDNFLRARQQLKSLYVVAHRNSKFPQIVRKKIVGQTVDPKCCRSFKNKCWRHELKDIGGEVNWTLMPGYSSKALQELCWQRTAFDFSWRSKR